MAIELSKLSLVLPEGCTISKEAALSQDDKSVVEVEVTFGPEPVVNGVIGVKYDKEYKSVGFTTVKYPGLVSWGSKSILGFVANKVSRTTAVFDAEIDLSLVDFKFPAGWLIQGKKLSEDKKTIAVTFLTPDEARTKDKLVLVYKGEEHVYEADVTKVPNVFLSITAGAESYPVGKEFELSFNYREPVGLEDKPNQITCTEGLKQVTAEPEIHGTKMFYRFVGEKPGQHTVTATAYEGKPGQQIGRMLKITIV